MLKSGGPYMTVSYIVRGGDMGGTTGDLECRWFDGPTLYTNVFHPSTVKAVEEPVAAPNDPEE